MDFTHRVILGAAAMFLAVMPAAFAQSPAAREARKIQTALGVSKKYARVIDAHRVKRAPFLSSTEPPEFILIQDMHRDPEVQSHIASLILHGYDRWGVKKVFVEGAFSTLDLSLFHRVPKEDQRRLAKLLVAQGELSGAELAAIEIMEKEWSNPPVSPFQLFGMEDPGLYRKNVQAYQAVVLNRERALKEISFLRQYLPMTDFSLQSQSEKQLARLERLVQLRITPRELQTYHRSWNPLPVQPDLSPAVGAAEEFYRLAHLRSHMFLHQVSRKVPASNAPRILVVGGFHTEKMAELLREQNRSFVVLSPSPGSQSGRPLYEERLRETAIALGEMPRLSAPR